MNKTNKIDALVSGAEKLAKKLVDNTIQAIDQNDDGKFDLSDVSEIAEGVGSAVKKGTLALKDSAEEKARLLELKNLQPIFPTTLDEANFLMPKFIRVVERDKKHAESEVCQGSIGFTSSPKGLRLVNIFRDTVEAFGLSFYPDCYCEFYYMDPSDRDRYIALDEYFDHLKIARINELQKIAQDLGAKYFKVTYREEQTYFSERKGNANAQIKSVAEADAEYSYSGTKFSKVELASEMNFTGHSPVRPQLKYLQRDPTIQTLVDMRMAENIPLRQTLMLKMSNTSGIKESDAVKIDAVLKGFKCNGNSTVENEAKTEARKYLEYEIEF